MPLRKTFAYRVPATEQPLLGGMRVLIPFGHRRLTGYLIEPIEDEGELPYKIKFVISVLDETPSVPQDLLTFLVKSADYYMHPLGEAIRTALPPGIDWVERKGKLKGPRIKDRHMTIVSINENTRIDIDKLAKRAPKRATIYQYIVANQPIELKSLRQEFKDASAQVKKMVAEKWLVTEQKMVSADPFQNIEVPRDTPPVLNAEQQSAVDQIHRALETNQYQGFLLHGITGSGKTEVYLHAAQMAISQGKGTLVLVPEITLTPQLVSRYRARFGNQLAVLHSGLSERDRYEQWKMLKDGKVQVAIGVRSALFAPIHQLGLILVDEEHDGSFKQERGFSYNARDLSLLRASLCSGVAVLGSATPSLESYRNAQVQKLTLLELTERATAAKLPQVEIVNLSNHKNGPNDQSVISGPLFQQIELTLEKKQQIILFLNRRGFAPNIVCKDCGTVVKCTDCAVSMTLHRNPPVLVCHYCGATRPEPKTCPSCNGSNIFALGTGTQKVERLLQRLFPTARIGRLDRDVANAQNAQRILNRLRDNELDILVGTQMITKGHDFPSVTLVGVLQSDVGLHMPDFRAGERTFQLLTQVSGRAGRADLPGKAQIQTYSPTHPAIDCAQTHDYHTFVHQELASRQELGYPPFGKLAALRLNSPDATKVEIAAQALMMQLKEAWFQCGKPQIQLLGPSPSPLEFLQNRFRWQIFLKSSGYNIIRNLLEAVYPHIESPPADVRIRLDIDPVSML